MMQKNTTQEIAKKYYLGLDMGTNSVGWAVTDENYHLLRAKGKKLWGVRLFEEAQTSAERRGYRTARRRRQREIVRLGILREMFSTEIEKVDPGFFQRLDDSKFFMEDRVESNQQPFALFADSKYTDREYYKQFPTIFHLRKELLESDQPFDVRLVYLALANMFKHRGHFLNAALTSDGNDRSFEDLFQEMIEKAKELDINFPLPSNVAELEQILGERGKSRTHILEDAAQFLSINKKDKVAYQILCLMCGLNVKIYDIFDENVIDEEHKKFAISFRDTDYEEKIEEIQNIIGEDNYEFIQTVRNLHDKGLLSSIMKGYTYLSQARVELYERHKKDLAQLKRVIKKYSRDAYSDFFRKMHEGNYSAYVGSVNSYGKIRRINKGRSSEELYKNIRIILKTCPEDDKDVKDILEKMAAGIFLPKQLTDMNGIIPNQVHQQEMKAILKNAEKYLPFLKDKDDTGLSVTEKILQLFSFQIPYYIGPLGQQYKDKEGYNVWAERKSGGRIYPWNFEEKIDTARTAEKFIERMVRHCTYLSGESALPKQSLLYQRYEVLNELNNLRVYGEKLPDEIRQKLFRELFSKGKKVTFNQLKNFLVINNIMDEQAQNAISGIDGGFHCSLSSLGKFIGALGERACYDENQEMIEKIIFWGTVYGKDKKFLKERIRGEYSKEVISDQELKRILGYKFEGWGRVSKSFLMMEGASKEDGVVRTIINAMWETGCNLMELLSGRFTYLETLEEMTQCVQKPLNEWEINDLNELYLSAPVKRMVWQTLKILNELDTVLGCAPTRIFVEMSREVGQKGERKDSRKQKLSALYKTIRNEEKIWNQEMENLPESTFRSKKLYLYYLQMGKCMYTGEDINIDELMNDNLYDIDHIYPRHFVKDDSIENNLVLVKKETNAHKKDIFPIEMKIQNERSDFWRMLLEKKFMTSEKYRRLTRRDVFSDEEKASFINRQLVETRQGTKAITKILQSVFPESKTKIIFVKAGNVSDFRNKYKFYKVRCTNDFHHAKDAYLNIVVGNVYYVKFTKDPLNFIREASKFPENPKYKYNLDKMFDWDVVRNGELAWKTDKKDCKGSKGTIATVRTVMEDCSPIITRMCTEKHGGITREVTIWSAKTAAKGIGYLPVKMKDSRLENVARYGGQTSINVAGYTLLEYELDGKKIRSLEALPVYLGESHKIAEEKMLNYFIKSLQNENTKKKVENVRICQKLIPQKSLIKYNGMYYYLGGKTSAYIMVNNAVQFKMNQRQMNYLKKIEKAVASNYYEEKDALGELILTNEKNHEIYKLIMYKFQNSIYRDMLGTVKSFVLEGEKMFCDLSVKNQCFILLQIFMNLQMGRTADLRLIGGVEKAGASKISKEISKAKEAVLVCQSAAGLYEKRIDLLTV